MQVDDDNASEGTAMSVYRLTEHAQTSTSGEAGAIGAEQERERTQTPRTTHCEGETHAGGDSPGTGNAPDHSISNRQIDNPGAGNYPSTIAGDSGGHLFGTSDNT